MDILAKLAEDGGREELQALHAAILEQHGLQARDLAYLVTIAPPKEGSVIQLYFEPAAGDTEQTTNGLATLQGIHPEAAMDVKILTTILFRLMQDALQHVVGHHELTATAVIGADGKVERDVDVPGLVEKVVTKH